MSVLDMFASALGAFMMCAIILMPYYLRDPAPKLKSVDNQLQQAALRLKQVDESLRNSKIENSELAKEVQKGRDSQSQLQECKRGLKQCQTALAKTFLLVQVTWSSPEDVNLHVTDPAGHEFRWNATNRSGQDFPDSKAKLSVDSRIGPGLEVWLDPSATAGDYKVDYVFDDPVKEDVEVEGVVYDRYGATPLKTVKIPAGQMRSHVATIRINADGTKVIR